jgi:hypothetical protein
LKRGRELDLLDHGVWQIEQAEEPITVDSHGGHQASLPEGRRRRLAHGPRRRGRPARFAPKPNLWHDGVRHAIPSRLMAFRASHHNESPTLQCDPLAQIAHPSERSSSSVGRGREQAAVGHRHALAAGDWPAKHS